MTRGARWAIAVWIATLLGCIAVVSRTAFVADLSAFLPREPSPAQQLLVDQLRDGVVSRLALIGLEGDKPEALVRLSKALADTLARDPQFVYVHNGEQARLKRDWEFLLKHRYLLSPAVSSEHFTVPALREALQANLDLLGSPAGMLIERLIPADPTGEMLRMQEKLEGGAKPAMREGVWFSADGRRALLLSQTQAPGFDIDAQQRVLQAIERAFDEAKRQAQASEAKLLLTGPGVFSVASREAIRQDAMRLSLIATALIALVMLVVYRSPRVLALSFIPVASAVLVGIVAVRVVFGSVHGITLGFGTTLIGETVDYAIYLFTGIGAGQGARDTIGRLWPTLRIGVATSICGFSAMIFSGFPGLAQLGVFSVAGLITAMLVTRWVLPALLPQGFQVRAVDTLATRVESLLRHAGRLRLPALALSAAALAVLAVKGEAAWDDRLESLNPVSTAAQSLDAQLRRDLGAPDARYLLIATAPDAEQALTAAEAVAPTLDGLRKQGAIEGYDSPAWYRPSTRTQDSRRQALPPAQALQSALQEALTDLPYQPDLFAPFLAEVETTRNGLVIDAGALAGTTLATKVDSLLLRRKDHWSVILPLREVANAQAVATALSASKHERFVLLDLKEESNRLYRTYRTRAFGFALIGAGAILALLLAWTRSPRRAYEVLIPLAGAVVCTSALLLLAGHRLTVFDLVALLLVVGVGSNYSLFFDHENQRHGKAERTFVSLSLCCLSAVIGFGLLGFSRTPVLSGIGVTVAIGALLSLLFSAALTLRRPV